MVGDSHPITKNHQQIFAKSTIYKKGTPLPGDLVGLGCSIRRPHSVEKVVLCLSSLANSIAWYPSTHSRVDLSLLASTDLAIIGEGLLLVCWYLSKDACSSMTGPIPSLFATLLWLYHHAGAPPGWLPGGDLLKHPLHHISLDVVEGDHGKPTPTTTTSIVRREDMKLLLRYWLIYLIVITMSTIHRWAILCHLMSFYVNICHFIWYLM